ncbi:MAG: tryptophan 7-halogenase [Planctomycetaceae bacterium]
MYDFDIAVIGGGPAGAAAAITAASRGLSVAIVEREAFPRPAPGESAHPGIQPLLKQLGVEEAVLNANFVRYPGHMVQSRGLENYVPFGSDESGDWQGFQLWRPQFDSILLNRAHSLGVKILQPDRAVEPIFESAGLSGVVTSAGTLRTRYVIDATGRRRLVSRWMNLEWNKVGVTRTAWYGYAIGDCPERASRPLLSLSADNWHWIARVRPDTYAWTHVTTIRDRPQAGWLPSEIAGLKPLIPPTGVDVTWGVTSAAAGPGYFLVGDAAFCLDPAAGHGILKALMSGIYAAHLVVQVLEQKAAPSFAAAAYSDWMRNWFQSDATKLDALYKDHADLSGDIVK